MTLYWYQVVLMSYLVKFTTPQVLSLECSARTPQSVIFKKCNTNTTAQLTRWNASVWGRPGTTLPNTTSDLQLISEQYLCQICHSITPYNESCKTLNTGTKPWILKLRCFPLSWHHLALVKQNSGYIQWA